MIPKSAIASYVEYGGDQDFASLKRVDMEHWGEIANLLFRLHNVDARQASKSFAEEFDQELASSGISLTELREMLRAVRASEAERDLRLKSLRKKASAGFLRKLRNK